MTELARCYLREAVSSYGEDRAQILYEGMKHYTDEIMEVVNGSHPSDLPLVLAAMETVADTVRHLPEYKAMRYAVKAEHLCRRMKPIIQRRTVEIRTSEDMYELPDEEMRGF